MLGRTRGGGGCAVGLALGERDGEGKAEAEEGCGGSREGWHYFFFSVVG